MKNKLFFLLITLLSLAAIISCGESEKPEDLVFEGEEEIFTDFEGVYLTLDKLGASSISVTWKNETNFEITFGEGYSVEILASNGEWVSVQKEEMSVPAIALMLPAGGNLNKGYSFKAFDLSRVGKYRLRCEFWHNGNTFNTWVQFDVTEENTAEINRIPDTDLSEFSDFLDREGFVKDMSQGQLMGLADKYSAELDPSIVPEFYHYDGEYGGGCAAYGEFFGYENYFYSKDGKVTYYNMLFTKVKIKSLKLPYGIKYGDGIEEVLKKLDIDRDIYKNTAEYDGTKLELYNDGTISLTLVNNFLTEAPVDFLYDYELTYTEKISTVTRTVKFSFSDSEKELACIELKTVDEFER